MSQTALEYITKYHAEHHNDDGEWLNKEIWKKISSVGGLLSEESAIMLIAAEHGWVQTESQVPATKDVKKTWVYDGYTELSSYSLDLIWSVTEKADKSGYNKYPKEPLVVKVLQIYDAKKSEGSFAKETTSVKIADDKGNTSYFRFEDLEKFTTTSGLVLKGNLMSTAIQQVREKLLGKTIAIFNWQLSQGEKAYFLSSARYTYFKIVDPAQFKEAQKEDLEEFETIDYDEVMEQFVEEDANE